MGKVQGFQRFCAKSAGEKVVKVERNIAEQLNVGVERYGVWADVDAGDSCAENPRRRIRSQVTELQVLVTYCTVRVRTMLSRLAVEVSKAHNCRNLKVSRKRANCNYTHTT